MALRNFLIISEYLYFKVEVGEYKKKALGSSIKVQAAQSLGKKSLKINELAAHSHTLLCEQ